MTSTTRKNASRKEVRQSIQEFAKLMSEAPEAAPKAPGFLTIDTETARRWEIVKNAR